jgi:hypothetical protein
MAIFSVPLDEVVYFDVITSHPTTQAVTDADSTPTFEVFEENTDTDIGIGTTMTKRTDKTGNYKGTFTASAANGFEVGKYYSVIASATVGSITGKCVALSFRVTLAETTVGTPSVTIQPDQSVNVTGWNSMSPPIIPTTGQIQSNPMMLTAEYDGAKTPMQAGASVGLLTGQSVNTTGWGGATLPTAFEASNLPGDYLSADEKLQLISGALGTWYSTPSIPTTGDITTVLTAYDVAKTTTLMTLAGNQTVNVTGWNGAVLPTSFTASNLPADYLTVNEQLQLASGAMGSWYTSPTGSVYTYVESVKSYGDTKWLTATGVFTTNLPSEYLTANEQLQLMSGAAGSWYSAPTNGATTGQLYPYIDSVKIYGDTNWVTATGTFATNLPVSYLSTNESLQLGSGAAGSWYSAPSGWATTGNLATVQTYLLDAAHYSGKYPSDILDNVSIQSDATVDTTALVSGLLSETVNSTTYNTTDTFGWLLNKIRNIATKVGLMVSSPIAAITPVQDNLDIDLVQYDDYTVANGRSLYWTNSDGSWSAGDITSSTVDLHIADTINTLILSKTGIITYATAPQRVDVELLSAETALLTRAGEVYKYQLVISSTGDRETVVAGKISNTLAISPS